MVEGNEKKLACQDTKQEWYHQFLEKNTDIKLLANKINSTYVGLTDHFPALCQRAHTRYVPDESLISEDQPYFSMSSIQISKAAGPGNIRNRLLKDFGLELALVVCDIYKLSLREGYVPYLLKSSIVSRIPKLSSTYSIKNDLRPISLTCTIAKVMKGFICRKLLSQLDGKIGQYSRKGHFTTDALQAIYEAVDSGEGVCTDFFSPDFTKGFYPIDHLIFMQELANLKLSSSCALILGRS